jgi:hypothetical protein
LAAGARFRYRQNIELALSASHPRQRMKSSNETLVYSLRGMLREVFRLRNEGAAQAKLAKAQGYADGYMRALLGTGVIDQEGLLQVIAEERRASDGPATEELSAQAEPNSSISETRLVETRVGSSDTRAA